jgi:predicted nucleic acid-binding protein
VNGALLDTSVLIAFDEVGAIELPETAAISAITVGELYAGVRLADSSLVRANRQARLTAVQATFDPLAVDVNVAHRYGEVLATARRAGRAEKATDLLIIATAAATGRTLHTLDGCQATLAELVGVPVRRGR